MHDKIDPNPTHLCAILVEIDEWLQKNQSTKKNQINKMLGAD